MAAFDLAVVPRGEDLNQLVPDAEIVERLLKECWPHRFRAVHPVRELGAVVRLDTFDGIGKLLLAMPDKLCSGIRAVLFEGFEIAKAAVFVNKGELVVAAVERRVANEAGGGHELHVDLYPLAWVIASFRRAWACISGLAALRPFVRASEGSDTGRRWISRSRAGGASPRTQPDRRLDSFGAYHR